MANEPKPHSGNAGNGAKVGGAGHSENGRDPGASGERRGAAGGNTPGSPTRGPSETKPPKKR